MFFYSPVSLSPQDVFVLGGLLFSIRTTIPLAAPNFGPLAGFVVFFLFFS